MKYEARFKPQTMRDLEDLSPEILRRIITKIEAMQNDLAGNVKRLTNYTPEYRLRVGDYRVLFEIEAERISIYRVLHRRESYR